jgi:RHS repeat-associated protein
LQERPEQDVNYYYDLPMGGYTQNNTWGRLSGVSFNQSVAGGMSFLYQYNYTTGGRVAGNRMLAGVTGASGPWPIDLQAQYTWDTQGRMTSLTYPSGPTLTYGFDAMGRANAVTGSLGSRSFNGRATYGSAGQLTSVFAGEAWTDSQGTYYNAGSNNGFTYNNMLQLTRIGGAAGTEIDVPGLPATGMGNQSLDVAYVYNAGHNNGRVIQTIDYGVNETVNYTYDYLHRLTSATGGSMGNETYSWDGFGNLIAKTPTSGSMPYYSGGVGQNATGGALDPRFDVEQRFRGGGDSPGFGYDPWGHRIFSQIGTASGELWFYGGDGRKLDTYQWAIDSNNVLYATEHGITRYMAGRLMEDNGVFMATDRLGSTRAISTSNALISYFPWGEERPQSNGTTTPDGKVKFGGYYRDHPGQNYAGARYYNEGGGYFTSPDPAGLAAAEPSTPESWNRGAYVQGDPINYSDPSGLHRCNWFDWEVLAGIKMAGDDGCEDGVGSGGGDCNPSANGLLPTPLNPACTYSGPGEPVMGPPVLTCHFAGWNYGGSTNTVTPLNGPMAGIQQTGFFQQIEFNFVADGGDGGNSYTFSINQTVKSSGSYLLPDGSVQSAANSTTESFTSKPQGPSTWFQDNPGYPGSVVAGAIIWNMSLAVTVSSGNQTASCGTVWWQAYELFRPKRKPVGNAYVVSVTP